MKENAKRRHATLLVGLSLLSVGTINGADDRHFHFVRVALNSAQAEAACQLTLAERVAYQYAIEEVYWRHRIWPKESGRPKPSLDDVIPAAQVQRTVENYLRDSELLADYWRRPITSEQLQAEMERMASQTKQPEVLQELFAALNNDPRLIAECLARPTLAERLARNFYAHDERFHGELKRRAESELYAHPSAKNRLGVATVASQKEPFELWTSKAKKHPREVLISPISNYTLPQPAGRSTGCTDDSWRATATAPGPRYLHTAVWTGSEMIVWGGYESYPSGTGSTTGGRYNPSTDSWVATSTNGVPDGRASHTAVWTGTEMIVWGGYDGATYLATGGRYNPSTDSWTATSTANAPTGRSSHTTVWTGSEMIVWGGKNGSYLASGGRYSPSTDSWVATSTGGVPDSRAYHTALWTGTEMIVWGGLHPHPTSPPWPDENTFFDTGGKYNPSTDSWVATSTSGVPYGRVFHTALWTGSEMIVWGGLIFRNHPDMVYYFNTGGRYNPSTDSWVATTTSGAPYLGFPTAVWTGNEMIVWEGGYYQDWNTNWRYSPNYYNWTSIHVTGGPVVDSDYSTVWTGSELIVWGGLGGSPPSALSTGGRYCTQSAPAQLGNLSTRLAVGTGDNALIGGFIIAGTQTKRVIIRALGPSLPVSGTLADPVLELHQSDGQVITNDNWRDSQEAEIIASGKAPSDDAESAIIATLAPGAHTAIVRGTNDTTGVALMEVWDLDSDSSSTMADVSTRGFVQTGDNVLIGGTIVIGGLSSNILVRAIGPSLSGSGVPNALGDPTLELHDGNGAIVATNDNWRDSQEAAIQVTGLAPTNDLESAILRTVSPGGYTAIVRGNNETTGIALVEVYALP